MNPWPGVRGEACEPICLMGARASLERVRQMPARLSVAAILALFAGCLLLMLRRIFGSETAPDVPEEAVATPL